MSTTRELPATPHGHGAITFICDTCDIALSTGYTTWGYANARRQDEGWRATPLGTVGKRGAEEWAHLCADCARKADRARAEDFK